MNARWYVAVAAGLVLSLAAPSFAEAQGTVTGRVTQGETLRPLGGAQISIPGTGLGALANQEGRFLIVNVPVGAHTIRVQMIGYGTTEKQVTVTAGMPSAVDFQLATEALGLDEIIVTGTAGGQQRRAVSNTVSAVQVSGALERSAPASLTSMLTGQVPGAYIAIGGGNVGSGGNFFIRGLGTMDMDSRPLVYVDGIRVNTNADLQTSRLNDINPNDIERVEIIKGPAAATLYGTEASNGVVQIVTKKGKAGATNLDFTTRQGVNWAHNLENRVGVNWHLKPDGTVISQNLIKDERERGTPIFRTGQVQNYALSLRGGQGAFTYYLSSDYSDEEGYSTENEQQKMGLRSNLQLAVNDQVDVSADVGVIRSDLIYDDDSGTNDMRLIIRGLPQTIGTPARGFAGTPPEIQHLTDRDEQVNRATVSMTFGHRPTSWLSQRLVVGVDLTDQARTTFTPKLDDDTNKLFGLNQQGSKNVTNTRNINSTYDYSASATWDPTPNINLVTTAGVQYLDNSEHQSVASGTQLPTPDVSSVSSTSVKNASENFTENKTLGTFIQQQLGWKNQAFLTLAIRADGNSAFGESFKAAYYPKAGASWVISDADFWNVGFVSSLKLRSAWGRSGLQPRTFAALKTYEPTVGPGDNPTLTTGNLGNPDLKPEVGTEIELGFDASLFSDRVTLEFTTYKKTTTDVILSDQVAPSIGFSGTRFVNVGAISNQGYEGKIDWRPIVRESVDLSLSANASWNKNRVEDLAGKTVVADSRGRWQHIEGYELGSMWSKFVATAAWGGATNKTLVNVTCYGGPAGVRNLEQSEKGKHPNVPCAQAPYFYVGNPGPAWNTGFSHTLTLWNALTVQGTWIGQFDVRRYSTDAFFRENTINTTYTSTQRLQGLLDPVHAAELVTPDVDHLLMPRADFIRLREVSLTYVLPLSLVERMGVNNATLTASGRNLLTRSHKEFDALDLYDPETKAVRQQNWGFEQARMPLAQTIVTTVRVTF